MNIVNGQLQSSKDQVQEDPLMVIQPFQSHQYQVQHKITQSIQDQSLANLFCNLKQQWKDKE